MQIVETALARFGAPVYVRHEIVHNRFVVERLESRGAVFVDELDEVPENAPVVFSAHGVPKSVPREAEARNLFYVDATCPLVSKVHREAAQHHAAGRHVILVGHAEHPEVIGTLGQLPEGAISLIECDEDVSTFEPPPSNGLAYLTQTTLSVSEAATIIELLRLRFPGIAGPRKEDICYATTNRQRAVREIAGRCDAFLVVGAPNSSNSLRLVEAAADSGCSYAALVQRAHDIDWARLSGIRSLGLSAGASAPETLVGEMIEALRDRFDVAMMDVPLVRENISFKLPRSLEERARGAAYSRVPSFS